MAVRTPTHAALPSKELLVGLDEFLAAVRVDVDLGSEDVAVAEVARRSDAPRAPQHFLDWRREFRLRAASDAMIAVESLLLGLLVPLRNQRVVVLASPLCTGARSIRLLETLDRCLVLRGKRLPVRCGLREQHRKDYEQKGHRGSSSSALMFME